MNIVITLLFALSVFYIDEGRLVKHEIVVVIAVRIFVPHALSHPSRCRVALLAVAARKSHYSLVYIAYRRRSHALQNRNPGLLSWSLFSYRCLTFGLYLALFLQGRAVLFWLRAAGYSYIVLLHSTLWFSFIAI